jgi:hypothetical protein
VLLVIISLFLPFAHAMDESPTGAGGAGAGVTYLTAQTGFLCGICRIILRLVGNLVQHERPHANTGHRSRANKRARPDPAAGSSSAADASFSPADDEGPRPTHDEFGRALLGSEYLRNSKCELCNQDGHLIDCDYGNLAFHLSCVDLHVAPTVHFFCRS